jgi:hypothetical protein
VTAAKRLRRTPYFENAADAKRAAAAAASVVRKPAKVRKPPLAKPARAQIAAGLAADERLRRRGVVPTAVTIPAETRRRRKPAVRKTSGG